ncbi:MAG: hypothetical protein L6R38_002700 [Xanthoria sp. 2 TBL-2021]|nr:MAG: hypothetical protein L6R38_002700 [Xanthoria sp. 2 TBL-2021]
MPRTPRKWTPREDEQLLRGVLMQDGGIGKPVDWSILAQSFANRTNRDCRKRWLKIDKKWNRGAWEAEEDEILLKAVERHEKKWSLVSEMVGRRNPDQCSRRWHDVLNPQIEHGAWSESEDTKLHTAVLNHGRDWKYIATHYFPNRSRTILSNRYSVISRKKQRLDCSTLSQHTDDDAPGTLLFPQEDHDLASQRNTEVDDELTSSCTSSIWRATESTLMDDIPSLDTGLIMPDMDMTFNHSSPPLNEGVNIECEDRHNEQLQDTAMFDAFAGIMNTATPSVRIPNATPQIEGSLKASRSVLTILTLENVDTQTRGEVLDILMKARVPTMIRID